MSDGAFQSYEAYIAERPNTRFAPKAAMELLKLYSTFGELDSLISFIQKYEAYPAANTAKAFVNTFLASEESKALMVHYAGGNYHFFDVNEERLLPIQFEQLQWDDCGMYSDNYYQLNLDQQANGLLLNLDLDTLYNGSIDSVYALNAQWLAVRKPGAKVSELIHLSNNESLRYRGEAFQMINDYFFMERINEVNVLKSFMDVNLISQTVDSIQVEDEVLVFFKEGKIAISYIDELALLEKNKAKILNFEYTEYEFLDPSHLLLSKEDVHEIWHTPTREKVTFEKVYPLGDYFVGSNNHSLSIMDTALQQLAIVSDSIPLKAVGSTLVLSNKGKWEVSDLTRSLIAQGQFDSIRFFHEQMLYAEKGEEKFLIIGDSLKSLLLADASFRLLKSPQLSNSTSDPAVEVALVLYPDQKKQLYTSQGKLLWEGEAEQVKRLDQKWLYIAKKKEGLLIDIEGTIIPIGVVQTVGLPEGSFIPYFHKDKFGLVLLNNGIRIKAMSEARMEEFLADSLFIFHQEGLKGLVNSASEVVLPPSFKNIDAVNDSLALCQQEEDFVLLNINKPDQILRTFQYVQALSFDGQPPLYKVREAQGFGILDARGEMLLPALFSEIKLVGDKTKLWYGVRSLHEIDYHIFAYFSLSGKLLFKYSLNSSELEKMDCP